MVCYHVSLTSQQETVQCMHCKQKYVLCYDSDLNAHVGTRDVQFEQRVNINFSQKLDEDAMSHTKKKKEKHNKT